jgi:hypothetical protein
METNIFPNDPNTEKLKSIWKRPGGPFIILSGVAIFAVIAYYIFPFLTMAMENTIHFLLALAGLGLVLYMITHRKLRLAFYYFYESIMKKLMGIVIEMDPFIIAEDYIKDMEKQRQKLYEQSVDVDGQKERIQMKITEKENEMNKLMAKAKAAQANNMGPELGNATRQIARLQEYIKQLSPIRDNLARIGDYLTKIHKNSAYLIEDAKNELELKKDLYKSVTSGNKALSSAMKIFNGDPEKKMLVEQSMEFLKEDIAGKLANMKKAISYSTDFMKSIDLDNATFEQQGLQMLENFNPDEQLKLSSNTTPRIEQKHEIGKVDNSYYNDLLK